MDIQTAGEFYFLQRKNVPRTLSKIERKNCGTIKETMLDSYLNCLTSLKHR